MHLLKTLSAVATTTLTLAATARGVAPLVVFNSPGPGLNAPWTDNGNVVDYGRHIFGPAGYTWDTWSGYAVTPLALARYGPSLEDQNSTTTAMPTDQDWGISLTFGLNTGGNTTDAVFNTKASDSTPDEATLFSLVRRGDDMVNVQLGNASRGWTVVSTVDMTTDNWKDFMVHYKAASQRFDLYVDDVLTVADYDMGHGNYALDFVQIQPSGTDFVDFYRVIKIGQVSLPSTPGDFNNDTVVNAADIDMLCADIRQPSGDPAYNLDGQNGVNMDDLAYLLGTIIGTDPGDTDTDTDVDLSDLGNLATNYEQAGQHTWGDGDFDCDQDVDLSDLGSLATYYDGGQAQAYSEFSALTGVEVPEPMAISVIPLWILMTLRRR